MAKEKKKRKKREREKKLYFEGVLYIILVKITTVNVSFTESHDSNKDEQYSLMPLPSRHISQEHSICFFYITFPHSLCLNKIA